MSTESPRLLMGRENPNGWKLESILRKIGMEVEDKTDQISASIHPQRDMIMENNEKICKLLAEARRIQISTYTQLDAVEPDRGPLSPRL